MGLFDSICAESGLIIDSRQRLILIAEATGWAPVALPIEGTNDRGGTMDVPSKLDANMKAVLAFGKTFSFDDVKVTKLDELLDEIRGDGSGATWKERAVSFALIDAAVFDAIVTAVAKNGATAWTRYAQLGLGVKEPPLPNRTKAAGEKAKQKTVDATTKRLCEAILAKPEDEATRKVYVDHLLERGDPRGKLLSLLPAIRKVGFAPLAEVVLPEGVAYKSADQAALKAKLLELAQFLAWGTALTPAYGEGQFTDYEQIAPYVTRARKKYAGMPELLGAVDANEKAWRRRTAD